MAEKKKIYLDYAATTPVDPRVMKVMRPYWSRDFGNASSVHSFGQETANAVSKSRETIADFLGAKLQEVVFTSGATESNNFAIKGVAFAMKKYGNPSAGSGLGHIITSKIEHPCVLESCRYLEKHGFKVTYLPVYENGVVKVVDVKNAITDKTILISIMYVNNEVGTIQPIAEIGKIVRDFARNEAQARYKIQDTRYKENPNFKFQIPIFHCDATQAVNYLDCNVDRLGVDLLSMSGHKIYGPKGVGALYIKKGTPIETFMHGGHQEFGFRAGTMNHPGIIGFGKAVEEIKKLRNKEIKGNDLFIDNVENQRIRKMRDEVIDMVLKMIAGARLNGDRKLRAPNNANFSFEKIEGESLLLKLDMAGIAVSTGSACASGSLEPSHVLMALGMSHEQAHGSIRVTLGRFTKESEIKRLLAVLPKAVKDLRKISSAAIN